MSQENNSGVNTILIVILLLVVVVLGVWFFRGGFGAPAAPDDGINVDVNLPTGEQGGGGTNTGGGQ